MKLVNVNISRNVKVSLKCQLKKLSFEEMKEVKEYVNARFEQLKQTEIAFHESELAKLLAEMEKLKKIKKSINHVRKVRRELAHA